jgi:hypothetical protein
VELAAVAMVRQVVVILPLMALQILEVAAVVEVALTLQLPALVGQAAAVLLLSNT